MQYTDMCFHAVHIYVFPCSIHICVPIQYINMCSHAVHKYVFPCSKQTFKMCSYLSLEDLVVFAVKLLQIRNVCNENDPALGTKEQTARSYLTV